MQISRTLPPPLPALQPDPQKCTVVGQGLELAETGQQAHFEVHLVDMAGDPCTTEQQLGHCRAEVPCGQLSHSCQCSTQDSRHL